MANSVPQLDASLPRCTLERPCTPTLPQSGSPWRFYLFPQFPSKGISEKFYFSLEPLNFIITYHIFILFNVYINMVKYILKL